MALAVAPGCPVAGGASAVRQTRAIDAASGGQGGAPTLMKVAPTGLFTQNPDAGGSYLFETRAEFANQRDWISSDFLLDALNLDPSTMQKRLGDAFYEQRLVREQLADLTGRSVAGGEASDAKYQELLSNGASYARQWQLRPGIALSAEQISHLTSDIAWLESQTVSLPDGSAQQVLVPKVYLAHVPNGAVQPGGALVTGAGVTIATEDIVNRGGVIDGGNGRTVLVAQNDIVNQGGAIKGGDITLQAGRDIRNESLSVQQSYASAQTTGSYTSLSNVATITATGPLSVSAGRDVSDIAGRINAGSAAITAGRDIAFEALQTDSQFHVQIGQHIANYSSVGHQLSHIDTTGSLAMAAGQDLKLSGTQMAIGTSGSGDGVLIAGQDLSVAAVVDEAASSGYRSGTLKADNRSVTPQLSQISTAGGLSMAAGQDLKLSGAQMAIGIAGSGDGILLAGRDLNLSTVTAANKNHNITDADNYRKESSTTEVGSQIAGIGNVTLKAGNNINIRAGAIEAGGALAVVAGNDINVSSGVETYSFDEARKSTKKGFFSKKTTVTRDTLETSSAIASSLGGDTVTMVAGSNLSITGSAVLGNGAVTMIAGDDLTIAAAIDTRRETHHQEVKKTGFLSGGGIGISYGQRTTTTDQERDAATQSGLARSLVGSVGGDLVLNAGGVLKVGGSDLIAGQDMSLAGKIVTVDTGRDDIKSRFAVKTTQDGFSLSLGGSVVNAFQTMQGMQQAAGASKNGRVQAMAAATAAMAARNVAKDIAKNGLSINLSLTAGHSESQQTQTNTELINTGSTLAAGNNLTISAIGGGQDSKLSIIGSDIRAGRNIRLIADNQVNLLAAQDLESQHSQSSSTSAAAGVAIGFSSKGGAALGYTASVSTSRGHDDGNGTTQVNTHVDAGETLSISSGGDTNIRGAVASGAQVMADIGGNLNLESLQDTAAFDSKSTGVSASATIGYGANVSASVNQSKSTVTTPACMSKAASGPVTEASRSRWPATPT
jgi:filamentous hemagglutinin